jgi:hypothetical protein
MTSTGLRVGLLAALLTPATALAQSVPSSPPLSRDERETLFSLVTAAKQAPPDLTDDRSWPVHILRASDGSHYVAFAAPAPPDVTPDTPLAVYVRLVPRQNAPGARAARSPVEEWLQGLRSDPLPMRARRVVQVPSGELPVGGAQTMTTREGLGAIAQSSTALALLDYDRRRAREEAAARERERRAELEGKAAAPPDILPFEDFDFTARAVARRAPTIERALTAGPGEYDLLLSWAVLDVRHRPLRSGVLRRALSLPAAQSTSLALSTVILADAIRTRDTVYSPDRQTAHPFSIGTTEIDPATDDLLTNDELLSVAFQVLNATPSPTGKPDVTVGLRVYRTTPAGDVLAATLSPLRFDESNLPVDFDLTRGHPLLAAMTAPLRTLPRGSYRLAITVADRLVNSAVPAEVRFRIVATPNVLLAAAPSLATPFARTAFTEPTLVGAVLDRLPPPSTPSVTRLIAAAREGRWAEVLPEQATEGPDRATALWLRSFALYALGDSPVTVGLQVRRAVEAGASQAHADFLQGACWALEGRDADAVEAWTAAVKGGLPGGAVAPALAEAYSRLGRWEETATAAAGAIEAGASDSAITRLAAAADIKRGREGDALRRLDPMLAADPGDSDVQWLALHALFASFARSAEPGSTPEGRTRFETLARTYVESGGRWSQLAEEWRGLVTAASPAP